MSACAAQLKRRLLRLLIKCDATSRQFFASVLFISLQIAPNLEFIYGPNYKDLIVVKYSVQSYSANQHSCATTLTGKFPVTLMKSKRNTTVDRRKKDRNKRFCN